MQKKGGIMFTGFNWQQMISAFIVLFAVIDIIGSIPIIINLKEKQCEKEEFIGRCSLQLSRG